MTTYRWSDGNLKAIKSIKTIFAMTMVAMIIIVFSLQTGFNHYQFSKVLEEKIVELLKTQARNEAIRLNGDFVVNSKIVESLAETMEALSGYDTETILGIMKLLMSREPLILGGGFWLEPFVHSAQEKYYAPHVFSSGLGDEYHLTWEYSNEKYDYFKYDWYKKGIQPGVRVAWSEPYVDEISGAAIITVSSPIKKDGRVIGVTTIDIALEKLIQHINSMAVGKSGYGFIVSSNGNQLGSLTAESHPQIDNTGANINRLKDIASAVLKEDQTGIMETVLNDQEVVVVFTPIGETGLRLVMVMPVEEAFASVRRILTMNIIVLLGSILLLTVMIFRLFEYKVAVPLQRLTKHAARIGSGDFDHVIKVRAEDEIGQLCMTFNTMSETIKKNIKETNNANQALRQAHDQLEDKVKLRTQDLLAMNQELQAVNLESKQNLEKLQQAQTHLVESEKMASLGNLVAGISHEINTPIGVGVTAVSYLQVITKEFNELYKNGGLSRQNLTDYLAESDEAVAIIFSNLERASQLIRSFKQISVDRSNEVMRVFNVKNYLSEILLSLHPSLKRSHHKITVNCDEKLEIDSFPGAFAQIITNFIMNSLIHAYDIDDAGQIIITIMKEGKERVRLTYSDDGKGMEKAVMEKIFEPFFTTKRGTGGTGLGLSILYNIVKQQFGGTVECISELGKGTTFIIDFPLGKGIR
ncbi:MAG: multi-sensor signal transduction histidine kinase [Firmicutes bacterium]|nr:multi-sensor signal transduction histidine kinase [Bacillota bacterium]